MHDPSEGRVHYGAGIFGHWYGVSREKAGAWDIIHHVGGNPVHLPLCETLDEAKAAAQADYERRILSALTASASEPEPVAWEVTLLMGREDEDGGDYWETSIATNPDFVKDLDPVRNKVRPLVYATPVAPPDSGAVEAAYREGWQDCTANRRGETIDDGWRYSDARAALSVAQAPAQPEKHQGVTEDDQAEKLAELEAIVAEHNDELALIDWISDKIGLPHDEELSRENFAQWLTALQAGEADGWRDIESAPKDGSRILSAKNFGGKVHEAAIIRWSETEDEWWDDDADQYAFPDLWMPLHAAPASKEERE